MNTIKILELFSGYGTATFALKRLGIPHEVVGYSDIDKYANQCFRQNHSGKELGDVKLINPNELEDFDLLTGGFPCQSFSVAGKCLGELDPRGTLFYEIIRIAEVKKPKYMLLENVKGLTCKKFKDTFDKILSELDRIGYNVYWKVLNSKDYGIPQSRARVWFVCFRKDIDEGKFKFPEETGPEKYLKDLIDKKVPEKYNLKEGKFNGFVRDVYPKGRPDEIISVAIRNKNRSLHQAKGLPYGSFPKEYHLRFNRDLGVSYAVKSSTHEFMISDMNLEKIRSLTPRECFRLQGFLNDEINLDDLSDTQTYKLAGNGQSVNVVAKIFERMFK